MFVAQDLLAKMSKTMLKCQWQRLIGTLNYVTEVVPLGRLRHRLLFLEGNKIFRNAPRDKQMRVPTSLLDCLAQWWHQGYLDRSCPWRQLSPSLFVHSDAANLGWGFQSSEGHQSSGTFPEKSRLLPTNIRELNVPLIFLRLYPQIWEMVICCYLYNQGARTTSKS